MTSDMPPVVFDDANPEWTAEDFARGRPISDFPAFAAAFPNGSRPKGATTSNNTQVAPRLNNDVLAPWRATGSAGNRA
ncbi:BrnA antitoxin family protein [Sphingomonas adhaesiva]|uniref:BrnA antitoxin family protein n=1 Tax=Sphingomonas adhaesiva TaxID=28212 RepID=UPI002FFCF352